MTTTFRAVTLLPIAALACASAAPARADSWAAPQVTEEFSASRDHFVRITPGTSLGDVMGFAGSAGGGFGGAAKGA